MPFRRRSAANDQHVADKAPGRGAQPDVESWEELDDVPA